jgi:hypothetical protein
VVLKCEKSRKYSTATSAPIGMPFTGYGEDNHVVDTVLLSGLASPDEN